MKAFSLVNGPIDTPVNSPLRISLYRMLSVFASIPLPSVSDITRTWPYPTSSVGDLTAVRGTKSYWEFVEPAYNSKLSDNKGATKECISRKEAAAVFAMVGELPY